MLSDTDKPKRGRPPKVKAEEVKPVVEDTSLPVAQAFASAVWAAQSPMEPKAWRLERVAIAMKHRGFSMDGIVL